MYFEVWHAEPSLDRAGGFHAREEALASLRQALVERGPDFVQQLSLIRVDGLGRRTTVAEGAELLVLVEHSSNPVAAPERPRRKRAAA